MGILRRWHGMRPWSALAVKALICGVFFCALSGAPVPAAWAGEADGNANAVDPITYEEAKTHPGATLYKRKNCMACHKWHGLGGTGYGATPINLRETPLDYEDLVEVISCGRPGTAMPYHLKTAYKSYNCFDLTREELGNDAPARGKEFVSSRNIRDLVDFIVGYFKTHPEVTKEDCWLMFGEGAKSCRRIDLSGGGGGH